MENEKDFFGILIDLDEIEVQKSGYDFVEEKVINYLLELFDKYNYEYAFLWQWGWNWVITKRNYS